jgi:hypothetical protein
VAPSRWWFDPMVVALTWSRPLSACAFDAKGMVPNPGSSYSDAATPRDPVRRGDEAVTPRTQDRSGYPRQEVSTGHVSTGVSSAGESCHLRRISPRNPRQKRVDP